MVRDTTERPTSLAHEEQTRSRYSLDPADVGTAPTEFTLVYITTEYKKDLVDLYYRLTKVLEERTEVQEDLRTTMIARAAEKADLEQQILERD